MTVIESANVWDLRPVSYNAIEDAGKENAPVYYGFIAEEVAEVEPRLCFWSPDAEGTPQVEGVNYDQVIPLLLQEAKLLKAGREQDSATIAALQAAREADAAEVEALKVSHAAETEALRARMAELEKKMEALLG